MLQVALVMLFIYYLPSYYGIRALFQSPNVVIIYILGNFQTVLFITKSCPCNIQRIFPAVKIQTFYWKNVDVFNIFAQNIDCGYMLEPPR